MARPAIALERLGRDGDALVVYELKHPFRDGTPRVCRTGMYQCRGRQDAESGLFEPMAFIARLAALVPRFHGLFAPSARHRRHVVPTPTPAPVSDGAEPAPVPSRAQMTWAQMFTARHDPSSIQRSPPTRTMIPAAP